LSGRKINRVGTLGRMGSKVKISSIWYSKATGNKKNKKYVRGIFTQNQFFSKTNYGRFKIL